MAALAQTFADDERRSRAMGIALGGLGAGILGQYTFALFV
jgi:hypothetical protein